MSLTTTISTMRWTASAADALWFSYALQFHLQLRIAQRLWHQNAPPCTNPAKQEAMPSKAWLPALSRVQGGSTCAGCKGKPLAVNEAEGRLAQQMLAFAERSLGKLCFSRPRSPEAERSGPRHFAGFRRKTESVIVGSYTFAESAVPSSLRAPNETHHTIKERLTIKSQAEMRGKVRKI